MTGNQLLEFKEMIKSDPYTVQRVPDRQARKLLLYLVTSTRGGFTRLRIIMMLLERPYNTCQLAQRLDLDYKSIQHHVKVLEKNNMIAKIGEKYGAILHLSTFMKSNIRALDEAIDRLEQKMSRKKICL